MSKVVRVGVGTMIIRNNTILFGLRSNAHGKDSWCFPGGHLEFGETPKECAIRETREETGLIISQVKRGPWLNDFFSDSQYITLFMIACYNGGEAKIKEKNKFKAWRWFSCSEPPNPLFLPIQTFLNMGYRFTDFFDKDKVMKQ
ncbi:MAG: NUDIX domain-containing protein [Candidatus Rhabdochlamydia sp.]